MEMALLRSNCLPVPKIEECPLDVDLSMHSPSAWL